MPDPLTSKSIDIPRLTGETLARMALEDFAEFFLHGRELTIPLTIGDTGSHASAKSKDKKRWIAISRDMAEHEIEGPATFLFHLLILGHEIAHIVHEHVYSGQQDTKDHSALEFWADFYGAKVMMTLITFGQRVRENFDSYFSEKKEYRKRLTHVGEAVDRMVETNIYNEHSKYPAPLVRVGLVQNGVCSFLRHNMGASFSPNMHVSIFTIVTSGPAVRHLMETDPNQADFSDDPIKRILNWHCAMQGDRPAITPDFKLHLLKYLHTTFDQTDEERNISKATRLAELHDAGYLLDVKLGDL